ncbi:MAG: helix-turn-helix transcriptional regulator [Candidatus Sumerlaeaceae bacterium]|nr:helix-turn-helix transcriptional regulator [Candidatus Sumerlaeaceae bacterium]
MRKKKEFDLDGFLANYRPVDEVLAEFESDGIDLSSDPAFQAESMKLDVIVAISAAMESRGMTRTELARKLGVSPQYAARILKSLDKGKPANFTLETIAALAMAVGLCPHLELLKPGEFVGVLSKAPVRLKVDWVPSRISQQLVRRSSASDPKVLGSVWRSVTKHDEHRKMNSILENSGENKSAQIIDLVKAA